MDVPHKALIFTDMHITRAGETIIGLDPLARFEEALAHALARHPDAAQILLLGDLTHTGAPEEYARLTSALRDCPLPVAATMGNHDLPKPFAAAFRNDVDEHGFAQAALDLGPLRILLLDTFDYDGKAKLGHDGWLCDLRLAWLEAELARAATEARDVVVACHHPPCPTGFWAMDAIGLANGDALLRRLRSSPQVKHLICGHIHRTIMASADGLPVSILKSTCHQMPMMLGGGTSADSVDEPGAYGILLSLNGAIVLHSEDFALSTGDISRYA
ncbi:metallophosphoesterase [Gymnodinialimonas sp. 2305UL16-5]|uniref:metallophosphoesterase n=1 Tax=Gymnodinialimonas mytili TaxID=3126503 RepID=UPI00309DE174